MEDGRSPLGASTFSSHLPYRRKKTRFGFPPGILKARFSKSSTAGPRSIDFPPEINGELKWTSIGAVSSFSIEVPKNKFKLSENISLESNLRARSRPSSPISGHGIDHHHDFSGGVFSVCSKILTVHLENSVGKNSCTQTTTEICRQIRLYPRSNRLIHPVARLALFTAFELHALKTEILPLPHR